jgi:hypothetical protein
MAASPVSGLFALDNETVPDWLRKIEKLHEIKMMAGKQKRSPHLV